MIYLCKVQRSKDPETEVITETRGMYAFENIDNALASYHQELAYRGGNRVYTLCVILGESGSVLQKESWTKQES